MSCCDENTARVPRIAVSRRAVFKGAAPVASVLPATRPARSAAQGKPVKLAYCSQLLCGVPYEVARSAGLFRQHGLEVELVYTRGGNAAMQALVGGAVDYGPRAHILHEYQVAIPRPRDPVRARTHLAFALLYDRLWSDPSREVDRMPRAEAAA
jgi:hypothetical protein